MPEPSESREIDPRAYAQTGGPQTWLNAQKVCAAKAEPAPLFGTQMRWAWSVLCRVWRLRDAH